MTTATWFISVSRKKRWYSEKAFGRRDPRKKAPMNFSPGDEGPAGEGPQLPLEYGRGIQQPVHFAPVEIEKVIRRNLSLLPLSQHLVQESALLDRETLVMFLDGLITPGKRHGGNNFTEKRRVGARSSPHAAALMSNGNSTGTVVVLR